MAQFGKRITKRKDGTQVRLFLIRSAACFRVIRLRQFGQYFTLFDFEAKEIPHTVLRFLSSAWKSSAYSSVSMGSTAVLNHLQRNSLLFTNFFLPTYNANGQRGIFPFSRTILCPFSSTEEYHDLSLNLIQAMVIKIAPSGRL